MHPSELREGTRTSHAFVRGLDVDKNTGVTIIDDWHQEGQRKRTGKERISPKTKQGVGRGKKQLTWKEHPEIGARDCGQDGEGELLEPHPLLGNVPQLRNAHETSAVCRPQTPIVGGVRMHVSSILRQALPHHRCVVVSGPEVFFLV